MCDHCERRKNVSVFPGSCPHRNSNCRKKMRLSRGSSARYDMTMAIHDKKHTFFPFRFQLLRVPRTTPSRSQHFLVTDVGAVSLLKNIFSPVVPQELQSFLYRTMAHLTWMRVLLFLAAFSSSAVGMMQPCSPAASSVQHFLIMSPTHHDSVAEPRHLPTRSLDRPLPSFFPFEVVDAPAPGRAKEDEGLVTNQANSNSTEERSGSRAFLALAGTAGMNKLKEVVPIAVAGLAGLKSWASRCLRCRKRYGRELAGCQASDHFLQQFERAPCPELQPLPVPGAGLGLRSDDMV